MASESVATETRPADVGLKRELGLIGATWASETSIIGSGWLFAPLTAALLIGGAAVLDWVIAGIVVILLALCHAELGAMYPVSGGTARFPHFAFGSVAGIGFGFFSYVQAVTIAPIECYAFVQYAAYYWPSLFDASTGKITGVGLWVCVLLMAVFTAVNFLAMRIFARVNNAITWWKVAVPVFTIIVLLFQFHPGNFTAGGAASCRAGSRPIRGDPGGRDHLRLFRLRAGRPAGRRDQEPGAQPAAGDHHRRPARHRDLHLLQVVFIGALPPSLVGKGLLHLSNPLIIEGPFAGVAALAGLGWLAHILRVDAFISPSGTGLIYTTGTSRVSYGLARNRYVPQIFDRTNANGVPWVGLIFAFLFGLIFLLPFPSWRSLVGIITGASVLMYAGAPLSLGAFRGQVPDAARPYRLPAAAVLAPLAFVIADLLIYWSGFSVVWKLGIVLMIGYVLMRHLHGVRQGPAAAGLEVGGLAAGVAARPGRHLLAGPVPQYAPGAAANQHLQHPVLVGHSDRRRLQPDHLLLGHGHQGAQGRDAEPRRAAGGARVGRGDRGRLNPLIQA